MKKFNWSLLLPSQRTIFLFPEAVVAVHSVRVLGHILDAQVYTWSLQETNVQEVLIQAKQALNIGKDTICHVGLPLDELTLVDFTLPLAAADDLDNAVSYALMRHVPFDLEDMRWEYSSEERGGQLEIAVVLMQRNVVARIMECFATVGIPVASVFPATLSLAPLASQGGILALFQGGVHEVLVWNGYRISWRSAPGDDPQASLSTARAMLESYGIESQKLYLWGAWPLPVADNLEKIEVDLKSLDLGKSRVFGLDLVSAKSIRSQSRSRISLLVAALILVLTLAFLPFRDILVWKQRVTTLEQSIAGLRTEAEALVDMRQQNAAFEKRMERWAQHFASNPDAAQLLREITEVVPTGAWLDNVQIQERKIVLDGSAPSATIVLEQLENSPLFQDMRFDAPVTKKGDLEVFRIAGVITMP